MTPEAESNTDPIDHGTVKRSRRARISFAWIFPLLAASAAAWLLWSNWKAMGPEIAIHFKDAPGISAGKSLLVYRGVTSGKVTAVRLNPELNGVIVTVRLSAFATGLARAETIFWIDQPVISLSEITGIESIIQGNSIHARIGGGDVATTFIGHEEAPIDPLERPALVINLQAPEIPFLERGTPVYHRGVAVGLVREKVLGKNGNTMLEVAVDHDHKDLVRTNSKFWILPSTSLKITTTGIQIDMASLNALVQGGVAFDEFGPPGEGVGDGHQFDLANNEFAARAAGSPVEVVFDDGKGLVSGSTRVTYLGQPVGLVRDVRLDTATQTVVTSVAFDSSYAHLARADTIFTLVRPSISLSGVSGLDTLITGPYIAVNPGIAESQATQFVGRSVSDDEWNKAASENEGLEVTITAEQLPSISAGAPVYYRGLVAGSVLQTELSDENVPSMRVVIHREFRAALRANSRFWRVPATSVSAGPGVLDVQVQGLAALIQGGIAFDVFDASPGAPATTATSFPLSANEQIAALVSPPIRIQFKNGRGLLAGKSELRYLGVPIGLVEQVITKKGSLEVIARFRAGYDFIRRSGATFGVVHAAFSLKGISGIETLVSGVYIDCVPGTGAEFSDTFVGLETSDPQILERAGMEIFVSAPKTTVLPGAQIVYRDTAVGEVTDKGLTADGSQVLLTVRIDKDYEHLVRENSRFWDASALEASLGFIKLKIPTGTIAGPAGRVAFVTPGEPGPPARAGSVFALFPKSQQNVR
jgi:paraquat-inducible protein B